MRFAAAPEYHVFPTRERPLKPYEAVVRAARDDARRSSRALRAGRRRRRHPHAGAGAGRRARGRAGGRRSSRTSTRARAPGFPPYSMGARLPRTARRAARLWRATGPRRRAAGWRSGRDELNETRARLGLPPLRPRPRRDLARSCASSATFPQLEYPRALAGRDARRRAAAVGAARPATSSCRPATSRSCSSRPSTSQDPAHRLLRAALEGLADAAGARAGDVEPPAARPRRSTCRANARLVEWVQLRADDAALRRRRLPRRPRDASRARCEAGCVVVAVPGRGRHERERRARWTGPASACGCRGASCAPRSGAARGRARAGRAARARRARRAGRLGARARPAGALGPRGARRGARAARRVLEPSGMPSPRHELVFASWSGSGWQSDWRPELDRGDRARGRPRSAPTVSLLG